MKRIVFIILIFVCGHLQAQEPVTPDSTFHRIILLDSMWVSGSKSKTAVKDSLSYLELKGDRVEYRVVTKDGERLERGRIYRLRKTETDKGTLYNFYIVDLGFFRGSWTAELMINGAASELHLVNPFSTYDRYFIGHEGVEAELVRPVKKNYKPKAHDRSVQ